jgi:predicted protein tyrosine phosphatase
MEQDPYLMNRLGNTNNRYQKVATYKRVVCVCSAGLLRSPTAAFVLSQEPFNCNTRAVGLIPEFALIPLDQVLLDWADQFVCMTREQADAVQEMLDSIKLETRVVCLDIPDNFGYRDPELMRMITERYTERTK